MAVEKVIVDIITNTDKSVKSMAKLGIATAGAMKAVQALVKFSKEAMEAARVQVEAEQKLAAVLKSTGGAVGITSGEMEQYAAELSRLTGIGDEVIINGQAMMATFTKIGKQVFPEAVERAADMSKVFGTDLQSSILQVGKALNDPILGVTQLRRVGVQLTEQQTDSIKAFVEQNDVMSAQRVILDELNTQFGGTARMIGEEMPGSIDRYRNAMGDLNEMTGIAINQFITPLRDRLTDVINGMIDAKKETMAYIKFLETGTGDVGDLTEALAEARDVLAELESGATRKGSITVFAGRENKAVQELIDTQKARIASIEFQISMQKRAAEEQRKLNEELRIEGERLAHLENLWTKYDTILEGTLTPQEKALKDVREQMEILVELKDELVSGSEEWSRVEALVVKLLETESELLEDTNEKIKERVDVWAMMDQQLQNQIAREGALQEGRKEQEEERKRQLEEELELQEQMFEEGLALLKADIGANIALQTAAWEERKEKLMEQDAFEREMAESRAEFLKDINQAVTDYVLEEFDKREAAIKESLDTMAKVAETLGGVWTEAFEDGGDAMKKFAGIVRDSIAATLRAIGEEQLVQAAASFAAGLVGKGALHSAAAAAAFAGAGAVKAIPLAEGGLVTRPTLSLVGEAGPEAVIPLDKMNTGQTINVYVEGSVTAEEDLARTIAVHNSRFAYGG
jgi:hypothetical protein